MERERNTNCAHSDSRNIMQLNNQKASFLLLIKDHLVNIRVVRQSYGTRFLGGEKVDTD